MKAALALALMAAASCAGTSADSRLIPAVAYRGTDVYEGPGPSTRMVAVLKEDTPVCAAFSPHAYGYRQVTFADGKTGFVTEDSLSL
ncbi:MAG: hypothetical protein AUI19_03240 [Myxococcales bacterium 13_1_40CM_2_68_15]|nr:MAG: hypothetical protein AUI19_03240 [Myxococcales bacterium 13_1_40CM_2_68_15]